MRVWMMSLVLLSFGCGDETEPPTTFATDFSIPAAGVDMATPTQVADMTGVAPGADMAMTPMPTTVNVNVGDNFFAPMTVTVTPGSTVIWNFVGSLSHSVTANNGAFDSGIMIGGTFSMTFPSAGTFGYFCVVHGAPGVAMFGTVVVQ